MRLLQTDTLEFKEFVGETFPIYAILSHTWGEEEPTLQDMQSGRTQGKSGYTKIKHCCNKALKDGFKYVWIDTCCIDKSSSAELSESLNSMYHWYKSAKRCYAYLVDVPSAEDPRIENSYFSRSRWFTRGWTLQELIAPSDLRVLASDWREIGTKLSLQGTIAAITGIDKAVLIGGDLASICIARKMSWAAKRETTRVEDAAYCLMGLFNVNMVMMYGEGKKAFIRLQKELMKDSQDHTLFAWKDKMALPGSAAGLLAPSSSMFVDSGAISPNWLSIFRSPPYFDTNKGLRIPLKLLPMDKRRNIYLAVLHCVDMDSKTPESSIGIFLKRLDPDADIYARIRTATLKTVPPEVRRKCREETIYIR